jgi:hypothetical protein
MLRFTSGFTKVKIHIVPTQPNHFPAWGSTQFCGALIELKGVSFAIWIIAVL